LLGLGEGKVKREKEQLAWVIGDSVRDHVREMTRKEVVLLGNINDQTCRWAAGCCFSSALFSFHLFLFLTDCSRKQR
jgi:hypothetical protein